MAPTKTRQLLGRSGDPLYDLCNPPPVVLVSRSDSVPSKKGIDLPAVGKQSEGDHANRHMPKVPEESPAYVSRSAHPDGNIIVTADYTGRIKVFRQDCAHVRRNESWETSSILSKKVGTGVLGGRRRNSVSHGSDRILSWRQSIASTSGSLDGSVRGGRFGVDGTSSRNRSISPRKSMGAISIGSNGTSTRFVRSSSAHSKATIIADNTVR